MSLSLYSLLSIVFLFDFSSISASILLTLPDFHIERNTGIHALHPAFDQIHPTETK